MKAAVLEQLDTRPVYSDFPVPVASGDGKTEVVMKVKAVALKNLDKLKTQSTYYAPYSTFPTVVGTDGVGTLPDGTMVYALGITGTLAESALISATRFTPLPDGIDPAVAAALPNAILGSAVPLKIRAGIERGDVVLVNGATGITGKVAVQVAKHYGAAKVIAVGRNESVLQQLGEQESVVPLSLNQKEEDVVEQLREIDRQTPIRIVLDYIWGRPAELVLRSLQETGPGTRSSQVRFVTVGDMAGKTISLPSGSLRSTDIALLGSGFGSLFPEVLKEFSSRILPEMFELAAKGKLTMETENRMLHEIDAAWKEESSGKRVVILIQ